MEPIEQILALKPQVGLVLALCALGFWAKRSPVPNWSIPLGLMLLGGVINPIVSHVANEDYTADLVTRNAVTGVLLGASSVGLHQLIKPIFPWLFRSGDTTTIDKKGNEV